MEQRKGGGSAEEARVKALFIYPVKSCAGISVSHAFISSTGFLLLLLLLLLLSLSLFFFSFSFSFLCDPWVEWSIGF
jgi:hypothetical protein